jgi:hypothetical protein
MRKIKAPRTLLREMSIARSTWNRRHWPYTFKKDWILFVEYCISDDEVI